MLSGVLRSKKAIEINKDIMRVFVRVMEKEYYKKAQKQNRQFVLTLKSLAKEEDLKKWYRE